MAKLYRFEICVRTPAGGTGKTLETRYTDSPLEVQRVAKEVEEQGQIVPAVERWNRSLEDYLIDTFQTDIVLGKNPYTEAANERVKGF